MEVGARQGRALQLKVLFPLLKEIQTPLSTSKSEGLEKRDRLVSKAEFSFQISQHYQIFSNCVNFFEKLSTVKGSRNLKSFMAIFCFSEFQKLSFFRKHASVFFCLLAFMESFLNCLLAISNWLKYEKPWK